MKTKSIIQILALTGIETSVLFGADNKADTVNKDPITLKQKANKTPFDVKKFFADLMHKWDAAASEQDPAKADRSVDHRFNITYAAYCVLPECAQKEVVEYLAKADNETLKDIGVHLVAKDGREAIVDCYLTHGRTIQASDQEGNTLLDIAVLSADVLSVAVVLKKGANVNSTNARGETALLIAARHGVLEIGKLLVDSGADVNTRDNNQQTPLFAAASIGRVDMAELLINAGAHVNVTDNNGDTPLHIAAQHKRLDMVNFLLSEGARTKVKNKDHLTPGDIARNQHYTEISKVLEERTSHLHGPFKHKRIFRPIARQLIQDTLAIAFEDLSDIGGDKTISSNSLVYENNQHISEKFNPGKQALHF